MGFSALSLGILTNSALASEPIPGSQKKVTGRGQRLGLSHNDVHLRHRHFFFRAYHLHSQELSSGPCMHRVRAIVETRTSKQNARTRGFVVVFRFPLTALS